MPNSLDELVTGLVAVEEVAEGAARAVLGDETGPHPVHPRQTVQLAHVSVVDAEELWKHKSSSDMLACCVELKH